MTPPDHPSWPTQDPDQPPSMSDSVSQQVVLNRAEHVMDMLSLVPDTGGPSIQTIETSGTGNYFTLAPDEIRHYEQRFQKVIDRAKKLRAKYWNLQQRAHAPADDDASVAQMRASYETLAAADKHLGGVVAYGIDYHNKRARSVHDYGNVDHDNSARVRQAASGEESGRGV